MNERVRIVFQLNAKDQQGYRTESLWAEETAPGEYRILNSPLFVFGVSAEDIVHAAPSKNNALEFRRVVVKGGHSTYRIYLQGELTITDECFREHWAGIKKLGATYENGNDCLVAVDIPPDADIAGIYRLLHNGETEGVWFFEEANYEPASGRVP